MIKVQWTRATYGSLDVPVQPLAVIFAVLAGLSTPAVAADPLKLVVLGDSLTAGYGIDQNASFPAQLEQALNARGHDVIIVNAGVSGDTASDGLARVDWSVDTETDAVIVELGANDALRGVDPTITRDALDQLLARLVNDRGLPVLLAGMMAPRNLGAEYAEAFDTIYSDLAEHYDALLYPFFLDGVATRADLNQADGIHPSAEGVAVIVERILPSVEALIERIRVEKQTGALHPAGQGSILPMIREGGPSCRGCLRALKSLPKPANDSRFSAAGSRALAG
ncbi:MAG: arylesterase [Hyphomicrobiales bacterium]|nr:arylesterase [Hyphomicrobiales bacterium]